MLDHRAIQQTNYTENLDRDRNKTMFLLMQKQKKIFWTVHKEL